MHYRLYQITRAQYDCILKDINNMSQLNYITNYLIKDIYLTSNPKEENDPLKKMLQFLIKSISNIHTKDTSFNYGPFNENLWSYEFCFFLSSFNFK